MAYGQTEQPKQLKVRTVVLNTMMDPTAPRPVRASASRVIALMAAGGEWPVGWAGLVPSLLRQLALAADATGGGGGGDDPAAAGAAAVEAENAVARAESCAKCLQYMTEEVRIS